MSFAILFVCTGNVCRSPMAELLCRAWADPQADLAVASAGMSALVGDGIDGPTASVLTELGVDPSRHRARQFEPAMAEAADLVLTAETAHRDEIMSAVPTAFRHVFTMKEFARLVRHTPGSDRAQMVAEVAWRRGTDGSRASELDDLTDPFRGTLEQAGAVAEELAEIVQTTLSRLGLAPPAHPALVAAAAAPRRPRPRPRPRPG